eukprot:scaffold83519_cov21-Tisochrysis_lutea.AAC.1
MGQAVLALHDGADEIKFQIARVESMGLLKAMMCPVLTLQPSKNWQARVFRVGYTVIESALKTGRVLG